MTGKCQITLRFFVDFAMEKNGRETKKGVAIPGTLLYNKLQYCNHMDDEHDNTEGVEGVRNWMKIACGALALLVMANIPMLPVWAAEDTEPTTPVQTTSATTYTEPTVPTTAATTAPTETTAETTVPTEPEATVPEETVPAETAPEETVPEETVAAVVVEEEKTFDTVPLYFQDDYPDTMYGSGTVKSDGCSVTALAMVASYLTDHEYLPDELAYYFGGTAENNIARLENGCEAMKLPYVKPLNWHKTQEYLQEGYVAIILMEGRSAFTDSQHFIVVTGINEDGLYMVNDPYSPNYERWDLQNGFQIGFDEYYMWQGYSGAWVFSKDLMPEEPFLYEEELPDPANARYPDIQLTADEMKMLAELVWVEARGESREGQQAVAEVVLNRLNSGKFGETLSNVVYGEGQFRSAPFLDEAEPFQGQYQAIERALYGPYLLPENVLYFATFPTNNRIWGTIGAHIFCYE